MKDSSLPMEQGSLVTVRTVLGVCTSAGMEHLYLVLQVLFCSILRYLFTF